MNCISVQIHINGIHNHSNIVDDHEIGNGTFGDILYIKIYDDDWNIGKKHTYWMKKKRNPEPNYRYW